MIDKNLVDNVLDNNMGGVLAYDVNTCEKLFCIIEEFNVSLLQNRRSISLDIFNDGEKILINRYSSLFFNFAPGKAVLVKWLLDEIHDLFWRWGSKTLDISLIRTRLDSRFGSDVSEAFCLAPWLNESKSLVR